MSGANDSEEGRKGSLFLRSDYMHYGRPTLNSNWHQEREAEPKDYDINKADHRDLGKATYDRIGNITDGSLPTTTYQNHVEQIHDKKDFQAKENHKRMITMGTLQHANLDRYATLDRDTGKPKQGYGSVLPQHHKGHNKFHLETTQADYKPPHPYEAKTEAPAGPPDQTNAYKRCQSQFSDTADYRRPGRNTFQDETGVYANSHFKQQCQHHQPSQVMPN